jgi:hypothetical protein
LHKTSARESVCDQSGHPWTWHSQARFRWPSDKSEK